MPYLWPTLAILATLIIIGLSVYAYKLLALVKKQKHQQAQAQKTLEQNNKAHDKKIIDSVIIITRAMKEEQCDFSEGCWRLSVLLSSLKFTSAPEALFPAIYSLYEQISHMPILEKRKALTKKERMKYDFQRLKIQAALSSEIEKELEELHQFALKQLTVLTQ